MQVNLEELDHFEDSLIINFKNHEVLQNITHLEQESFLYMLLQRRFISFAFTSVYDLAIDALEDEQAIKIARYILREEYPDINARTPSHREDLFNDLLRLGVSKAHIIQSQPSDATMSAIKHSLSLVTGMQLDETSDVKILTALRFWGEVLVSVEYGQYWQRISRLFMCDDKNTSKFYYAHHVHDAKKRPLSSTVSRASTHSDRLASRLVQLISSNKAATAFREIEENAFHIKYGFYDQFKSLL